MLIKLWPPYTQEKFEHIKGVIRSRNRRWTDNTMTKRTNNDLQRKQEIEQHEHSYSPWPSLNSYSPWPSLKKLTRVNEYEINNLS